MASNSYIRREATTSPATTGKQLMINIKNISNPKGIRSIDMPIPSLSADKRQLIPTTGQVNDYIVDIEFVTEASNVAYDVNTSGTTSTGSNNVTTIKEQYNFLYDTLMSSNVNTLYEFHDDFLGITKKGHLFLDGDIDRDTYSGIVTVRFTLKEGQNFLKV